MINYILIRHALAAALESQLGTYTFSNGADTPAVQIDDGSDPSPEQPRVDGLELVIVPSVVVAIAGSFGGFRQTFRGDITVRQWDVSRTTMEAMPVILDTLRSQFPELQMGGAERVLRSLKLNNVETFSVQVRQEFLMD